MENGGSILAGLVGFIAVCYLGYYLEKERRRRRRVWETLYQPRDPLVVALDEWMLDGQLQPLAAGGGGTR